MIDEDKLKEDRIRKVKHLHPYLSDEQIERELISPKWSIIYFFLIMALGLVLIYFPEVLF